MKVDFGVTAIDYAKHRPGFPSSLFDRLSEYSIGLPGQKIVDLGTGTGTLARGLAARGSDVIGLDRSAAMLEQARLLSESAQLKVDYRVATAEGKLMEPLDFSIVFTWYSAAIAATIVSFPLMYKTALGAFEQIDTNLFSL